MTIRPAQNNRSALLEGAGAFLLALGCARAWLTLVFAAPALPAQVELDAHRVFDYAYCALALVIALSARRLSPLRAARWACPLAGFSMLGASLLAAAAAFQPAAATPLAATAALLGGIGFSMFLLLWSEALARLGIVQIALFTSASQLFGVAMVYFCQGMAHQQLVVAMVVLPVIALAAARAITNRDAENTADEARIAADTRFTIPWKLIALMAVYSFAYGLREHQLAAGAGMYSSVSTGLGMAAFFVCVYFFSDRLSLGSLYKSTPLLMICGFLLIPADEFIGNVASSYLISIGYALMSVLVALLLYDISKRFGIAIIALAGLKNAMQIFVVAGNDCARIIETSSLPPALQEGIPVAAVIVLIFVAASILFSEKELTGRWGVRFLEGVSLAEDALERKRRVDRCDELSRAGKLSPREDEILRLYAQGKNGPAIERELFIAEGTLKTHTRHIYEKLGVSGRKELKALLGVDEKKQEA